MKRIIRVLSALVCLVATAEKRIPVGGQAVIEGVLMKGPQDWGLSVRKPDGGIWHSRWSQRNWSKKGIWRLPIFRGVATMAEMLSMGMKALTKSAHIALGEEESFTFRDILLAVSVALLAVVGLFILLPVVLADHIAPYVTQAPAFRHILEGVFRAAVFVGYVAVIGLWKDMQRVFAYHGAEHKTINSYEAGDPLEPERVMESSRIHRRCGTSFILVVVVVSIVVFSIAEGESFAMRILSRIVLLPLVVGISYEFIRWCGNSSGLGAFLIKPALCLQYLTTREPDLEQVAIGIDSLQTALGTEESNPPPDGTQEEAPSAT
ncbi:MAG: DUF1385 domain-containing protein [Synergistales bacterium]|nr:DUF1385 domain-containing protein [Synergistales bacterium]